MGSFRKRITLQIMKLMNYILVALAFGACWYLYYAKIEVKTYYQLGNYVIIALYFILYVYFVNLYNGTQVSLHRISEMIYSQVMAFLVSDGLIFIAICIIKKSFVSAVPGLICILGQGIIVFLWCEIVHKWYFKNHKPKKSIVVYNKRKELDDLINEYGLSKKFNVEKKMTVGTCLEDLSVLNKYETVFINDVHSHERNIIMKYCLENNIEMFIVPRLGDVIMSGATSMHIFHLPIQRLRRENANILYLAFKRIADIVISLLAIIITSPFMIITAIAIKVYDGGSVFYGQDRLTKDARVFRLLKFRSMKVDAEKETGVVLSSGDNDPRITPIGRFIRKIRFDELPQLFNILKGDMSIVGPRPERPEIAKQYEKKLPEFKLRLQVKAGLTGYAQVYGKYNTTPYNKLKMDLMYIANLGFFEDLRICLATIKILFMPESTEGIKDGQKNAMDEK